MRKEDFWNLIDEINQLCPTRDQESIMAVTTDKLMRLDVNDILDFHMIQQEYFRAAYRNDLHAASEAMGATPSYEGLQGFVYWLISCGKEVFIQAMDNPDTLADVPLDGEKIEFPSFCLTTKRGTRTYRVTSVSMVSQVNRSGLMPTVDNVLTLYTCVRNQPSLRWCVRAELV